MLPFACSSFGCFAPSTAFDPLNNYVLVSTYLQNCHLKVLIFMMPGGCCSQGVVKVTFPTCLLEPSPHAYTSDGFHKRQFTV